MCRATDKPPSPARAVLAAVASLAIVFLTACSGPSGGSTGAGGSTGSGGGSSTASGAPSLTEAQLLSVAFDLVQDSSGKTPAVGAHVRLAFEPNGVAQLALATDTDWLSFRGTYSFDGAQLTLAFTDPMLPMKQTFPLDLRQSSVTMPFQIFSTDAGSSQWMRTVVGVSENLYLVFAAAAAGEQLAPDQAIARGLAYANAYIAGGAQAAGAALSNPNPPPPPPGGGTPAPQLVSATAFNNGLLLNYDSGPPVELLLYDGIVDHPPALSVSPLAGNPSVNLPTNSPMDGDADPLVKTAVLFEPFNSAHNSLFWIPGLPGDGYTDGFADTDQPDAIAAALTARGYTVTVLKDAAVTVDAIITALTPAAGGSHSPGYVMYSAHGTGAGSLVTGQYLGTITDDAGWRAKLASIQADLVKKYPTFPSDAVSSFEVPLNVFWASAGRWLTLTPSFWTWLVKQQKADFSDSLVYINACDTDYRPELRRAIQAGAYFAYNQQISFQFSGAVGLYLAQHLSRHTVSAEETYYDILRVANTRQMVYKEDKLLDGVAPLPSGANGPVQGFFSAYSYYGGTPETVYLKTGWLAFNAKDPTSLGEIWTMVSSARFGQDVKQGTDNLQTCWNGLWSSGQSGGVGTTCGDWTAGRPPTEDELSYAYFLLTGAQASWLTPYPTPVPRWTLNDLSP